MPDAMCNLIQKLQPHVKNWYWIATALKLGTKTEKWGQAFFWGQKLKIWDCPQKSETFDHRA